MFKIEKIIREKRKVREGYKNKKAFICVHLRFSRT